MHFALLATATLLLVASTRGTMMDTATDLFHCIEKGLGWYDCKQYCTTDATFEMQACLPTLILYYIIPRVLYYI